MLSVASSLSAIDGCDISGHVHRRFHHTIEEFPLGPLARRPNELYDVALIGNAHYHRWNIPAVRSFTVARSHATTGWSDEGIVICSRHEPFAWRACARA